MTTQLMPQNSISVCPDCDADIRIVHLDDNVHMLQILHDDTCPTYAQMEADK